MFMLLKLKIVRKDTIISLIKYLNNFMKTLKKSNQKCLFSLTQLLKSKNSNLLLIKLQPT